MSTNSSPAGLVYVFDGGEPTTNGQSATDPAAEWRLSGAGLLAILADAKRRCGMSSEAQALSERAPRVVETDEGAEMWRYHVKPDVSLVSFDFRNQQLPARLNTSYRYSVKGMQSQFCTDIASGAHAHVYPPKHSHWGHGLVSNDYETVVMIRNIAHNRATTSRRINCAGYESR